jgi:hypothetical protein
MGAFGKYPITAERTDLGRIPLKVTIPVKAIIENLEELKQRYRALTPYIDDDEPQYRGVKELERMGVPSMHWQWAINISILPGIKDFPHPGLMVDSITEIQIEGDNVCFKCSGCDPSYKHSP